MDPADSTYGWDVVFATRASVVNAGLAAVDPQPFETRGRRTLVVAAGPAALTVLSAAFPQAGFGPFETYATAAVQAWLDEQTSFPYVLAEVRLGPASPGGGPDRDLAPVHVSYAYSDTPDGGGVLGVLATVAGGAAPDAPLPQEVSPHAVNDADTVVLVGEAITQRLLDGAAGAVTLPGTPGSRCRVGAPLAFPVTTGGAT